jgi:hypothetical protein
VDAFNALLPEATVPSVGTQPTRCSNYILIRLERCYHDCFPDSSNRIRSPTEVKKSDARTTSHCDFRARFILRQLTRQTAPVVSLPRRRNFSADARWERNLYRLDRDRKIRRHASCVSSRCCKPCIPNVPSVPQIRKNWEPWATRAVPSPRTAPQSASFRTTSESDSGSTAL